jgi:protein transport protein SEC61 subunit alpha
MSNVRLINLIEPISHLIPYVEKPKFLIKPNEKLVWTGMVLFIYLIYSQIPLYGIYKTQEADPLHYMRVILASSKGTLAELGITPIISSSFLLGFLKTIRVISVDPNIKEDRILFEQTTKFFAIVITLGHAIAYVLGGMYGPVNLIGTFNSILLIVQLVIGGIIIIILDELLSKEYGLISGISLFVATNISENLMWKCFSPFTVASERGIEYEGAVIALFHFLITKKHKLEALRLAFFRQSSPNLLQILSTLVIFALVIYLWRFKIEIKLTCKQAPGASYKQPIKLFYSSTTPVILINTVISKMYLISQVLYRRYGSSLLIKILGTWSEKNGEQVATGGIAYFVTPPKNFFEFIVHPLKSITYVIFFLYFSGWFTQTMVDITGKGAIDLARALKKQGFFLEGIRENEESIFQRLEKIIPTVSFLSGMVIAALQILADLIGATGSGTGILLLVSTILQVQENNEDKSNKGNVNVLLEE